MCSSPSSSYSSASASRIWARRSLSFASAAIAAAYFHSALAPSASPRSIMARPSANLASAPAPRFTARRSAPSACLHLPRSRKSVPTSASRRASRRSVLNADPNAASASSTRSARSATTHRYPHTFGLDASRMFASASAASAPSRSPPRSIATAAPSHVDARGHISHAARYTPRASSSFPSAKSAAPRRRNSLSDAGGRSSPPVRAMACAYASSASADRPDSR